MQRYLWQQADGRRHVYDTTEYRVQAGRPFTALCGDTVIPQTERGDLTTGLWFDRECPVCTVALAKVLGWLPRELAILARRFEWDDDKIARLADMLGWTVGQVRRLVTSMPSGVTQ